MPESTPVTFTLPSLPFAPGALAARGMCQETLEFHHGKHHQAYVNALNGLVEKNDTLKGKTLEEVIKLAHGREDLTPVFNNAGQHWNHSFFWNCLSPSGGGIPGDLEKKLRAPTSLIYNPPVTADTPLLAPPNGHLS